MTERTKDEMNEIYRGRRKKAAAYLTENNFAAAVFIDSESHRDPAVPYLTGHPSDAVLILFSSGQTVLVPWDEILAKKSAFYDKMIPYTRFRCSDTDAVKSVLNSSEQQAKKRIELPPYLTYPNFLKFVDALSEYDVRCREHGAHEFVTEMRMVKDEYEIECTKEAARIGDIIIGMIEEQIKSGEIRTETDVALLIERECRKYGCQRTGFDTLAAGPSRSFAIHAFPNYTSAPWPGKGLSILDFGVVYNGYTSDTTVTVASGELTAEQERQLSLVQKAYDECLPLYRDGIPVKEAAERADAIFAAAKRRMPHTLGHAVGLEIHEQPRISSRSAADIKFKAGMIVTLEPGLYDETTGGCRLENDVLITEEGNEVISHSRVIRI